MAYIALYKKFRKALASYQFKICSILLLTICGQLVALAQSNQYKFVGLDINHGLSNNQVTSIYKDSKGFMWFGTMSGLNRYDGYNFKVFKHSLSDTTSISDNFISRIVEDNENNLWISTRNGINIYDPKTESFNRRTDTYLKKFGLTSASFSNLVKDKSGNIWIISSMQGIYKREASSGKIIRIYHKTSDTTTLSSNSITSITEDFNGNYWVINRNGIFEKIDKKTNKVVYRNYALYKEYKGELMFFDIFIDKDNDLWILAGDASGLHYFNKSKKELLHLTKDSPKCKLNTNIIRNIVQDEHGIIWIGTDHGGINLLNKKDFTIRYLLNNVDEEKSISQNTINSMYKDNLGIIWIGTYKKGINYYHEKLIKFQLVKHKHNDRNSLGFDDVNCFVQDQKGNLWIGTNGGGLFYYNRKQNQFTSYYHQAGNPNSISNDIIISLFIDQQQKLWISTYFGGLNVFDGKRFQTFRHDPSNQQSLSDDRVWRVYEDSKDNMWIGTLGGGLNLFDRQKEI